MPTIKTIKPDGSGDFTTLAAWEDWADGQASGDQWAECYSGGNLGNCDTSGWASIPTFANPSKIYAAPGHRQDGTNNDTQGAYISGGAGLALTSRHNTIISGLRLIADSQAVSCSTNQSGAIHVNILYEGNFFKSTGSFGYLNSFSPAVSNLSFTATFLNNIALHTGSSTGIIRVGTNIPASGPTYNFYHNTFLVPVDLSPPNVATTTFNVRNNIFRSSGATPAITYNTLPTYNCAHNITDDATADDKGGSGHQINANFNSLFRDLNGYDLRLAPNSPARGTGSLLPTLRRDLLGRLRPQGRQVDIGAFEYPTSRQNHRRLAASLR